MISMHCQFSGSYLLQASLVCNGYEINLSGLPGHLCKRHFLLSRYPLLNVAVADLDYKLRDHSMSGSLC